MNNKNVIFKKSIEQYQKKYRNHKERLLKYSKEDVEKFDKLYGSYEFNGKEYKLKDQHYLLKNRKWMLIDNTYYEIPKAPRWTWFRNLKASTQVVTSVLLGGALSCGVVFPTLFATIWKPISVNVDKEVEKYVDLEIEGEVVVGKSCVADLVIKKDAKTEKQLPKTLKAVYTGGVKLDEYNPEAPTSNLNHNDVEPENYYTYTYTKDKGVLYIKKVLGPISIEMNVEERTYTVTFDKLNGSTQDVVEVKHNAKVNKPTDPLHPLCNFQYWSLKDKNEAFNFNTLINKDITLKAHWEANATGVIIRGINGLAESYSSMADAYTAGNTIMKDLNPDLTWGTCTKEKFLETFNDVTLDDKGFYKANITWELYTKTGDELTLPGGSTRDEFFYSFGRVTNSFFDGDDTKLFLHKTNVVGITETKPKLKYEASDKNPRIMSANTQHTSNTLENPFTFKNIDFDDSLVDTYLILQTASPMDYYLTVDGCNFVKRLCVDGTNKHLTVKNCVFDGTNSTEAYALEFWSGSGAEKSDYLVFENNTVKNYKRGIQLNCSTLNHGLIKGNTFKDTNPDKKANGAVQLSCGTNTTFDIVNNTFDNCKSNCFKIHENFTGHATVNINDNIIKNCGYVGLSENDKTLGYYTLNSANNVITNTTKDKAGNGTTTETTDLNYIVVLNEKSA